MPVKEDTRPLESTPAAALPIAARDGLATAPTPAVEGRGPRLTHGSLPRTIATVALPAVASMLLMTVFGTADAYWVGTRIGPQGLAAVSISVFWIWMVIAIAELVSVGLTAVAARRHGEGKPDQAARVVNDALLFALALGAIVCGVGLGSIDRMFAAMHAPPDVTALGRSYLATYLLGAPLIFGFFAVDAAFRAAGDTRTPFVLLLTSVAAALLLDPVLILGLGPAPRLGIAGAAVATVFTRGVVFVAGIAILARRRMIHPRWPTRPTIVAITRVGLPTAVTGVFFSIIYVLLTRTTTRFGTPALAALGVGHRVESWSYMIGVGFGVAAAAIVAQSLGARDVERASRAGWTAMGYASFVGLVGAIVELTMAERLAALFTDNPAVIAEGAHYLRIASLGTIFIGAEMVLEGALGGAGDTFPPMLTSTMLTAMRVPLAVWAAPRWGTAGIWWVLTLTAAARGIAMAVLWRMGRWKRRRL